METSIRIIDYHLKSGITVWILVLRTSGSNGAWWTLICPRIRQADPPRINRETPKE
jgi:hypothetical protein